MASLRCGFSELIVDALGLGRCSFYDSNDICIR